MFSFDDPAFLASMVDPLWIVAGAAPTLGLPFARNRSLVDAVSGQNLITFTRASVGTFVNSDGVLQTAANDVPRFDHNPVTRESLGLLLEELRSNLLLNSGTLATQNVTVTAAAHTLHFTGTGTVTLSGASTAGPLVGNGTKEANRVSLTFTPTAGTLTLTVSGTVTNAQLEAGSFRTSYIPTTTAAATRAKDVASISGSNFSSWYRQDKGTVFCDANGLGLNVPSVDFQSLASFSDGTNDARIELGYMSSTTAYWNLRVSNSSSVNLLPPITSIRRKLAGSFDSSIAQVSANGSVALTENSVVIPTVNKLDIGGLNATAIKEFHGTIRHLVYWGQRLPGNVLQAITQ